jgi:polar amino acid transport system substrate-binding protein
VPPHTGGSRHEPSMPTKRFAIAVLLALCATPAAYGEPTLYLATENSPPSSMLEGGRVVGIGTDKVREIMSRAGIAYTIDLLPWKRAYTAALERSDACVFSTTRTPEREPLFKWVGPTDAAQWVLLARVDSGIKLHTLEDARRYRIGTYNGDARDQFLRERGFTVDPAPNEMLNPRKLQMGRIDLWAASWHRGGNSVLEQNGWDKQIVPVLVFNRTQVFLACNRGVPDALVERMNAALDAMGRDGTLHRIEHKYDRWGPVPGAATD